MKDETMRDALRVLNEAARRGLPVLDRYDTKWVREGHVWRNVRDGWKRTSLVLVKFAPLRLSTMREPEPQRVGGVNVPGQWLTTGYVSAHQAMAVARLQQPRMRSCEACGVVVLASHPEHVCGVVGRDAVAAALPWRKEKAA